MDNEITVTVMVTFYDQKKYIMDSLGSVIRQKTDFDYEVLCGDDGSTDGTYEELIRWQKKFPGKISVYRMPRDNDVEYEAIVRVSNNRTNLLKYAKGKYITFLDGDDYYVDDYKLQKQVNVLEKSTDCVGCGHPIMMMWEDTGLKKENGKISKNKIRINNKIYWSSIWLHSDTFLFKNVYKEKESLINKDFFDDNLITCYFIKYGDIIYLPEPMVVYRQISKSSWNKRSRLQQALVNMQVYHESKKVLKNMDLACYLRCYAAMRQVYRYRNEEEIDAIGEHYFGLDDRFVKETGRYRRANLMFKILYELRYFILMHCGLVIILLKKGKILTYKKID